MTHRHVFFADERGPVETSEWTCGCGLVAGLADGDLDGGLLVMTSPAPDEFAVVAGDEEDLLVAAGRASSAGRRTA
jgi:hypothetical protein